MTQLISNPRPETHSPPTCIYSKTHKAMLESQLELEKCWKLLLINRTNNSLK